jgi:hypothetical protein
MSQDRVNGLLAAYFTQPYVEYGEVVLEIRSTGGLTSDEAEFIKSQVLRVDASTILRHAGTDENEQCSQAHGD